MCVYWLFLFDWVVYKLGTLLGSVGHRVKIHKITPVTGKERGDIEIKDWSDNPSHGRGSVQTENFFPDISKVVKEHWVERGPGTPKDRDEVNKREVCVCDG